MEMRDPRMVGGITLTAVYVLLWAFLAFLYFGKKKLDAIFLLAILGTPSSFLASEFSHAAIELLGGGRDALVLMDFAGLLLFGIAQYFLLGYILGAIFRKLWPM